MPRVVIVGAGISGLALAYRLGQARPDVEVIVLERDDRPGGKIWTHREAGFQVEAGPNGFLDTKPTTLNLCRDRLRRRRETAMAEPPEVIDAAPTGEGALLGVQIGVRIEAALGALPERQREAIVLCHHQGLGNKEAAALLGVSVETLESLLGRGRRALRAALADLMEAVR